MIKKTAYNYLCQLLVWLTVLLGGTLTSCHDDLLPIEGQAYWEGDGRDVSVTLNLRAPRQNEKTRALLSEEQEKAVNDLYVLMFRLSSEDDANPRVIDIQHYYTSNQLVEIEPEAQHDNAKVVGIKNVPTGTYYIAAVANVQGSMNSVKLKDDLDAVTDWNSFKNVQVQLQDAGNLGRTSVLTMSGFYMDAGKTDADISNDSPKPNKVIISQTGQLNGYIHLRRLDAQVHFNIIQEITGVSKFRIKSWQLVNIPFTSRVVETMDADLCTQYDKTGVNTSGWTSTQGVGSVMQEYQLDFYMMENRGLSKHGINKYQLREEEEKDASGKNFDEPQYTNAPDNSAYLVLEAEFEQTVTEGGKSFQRYADTRYVIHLGYCDEKTVGGVTHKANDFNNERNTRYTYNVRIRGANEVVVEADDEPLDTWNHGTEGNVIDVRGGVTIDLDAHFGVFNIILTPKELADSHFMMKSPMGSWTTIGNTYGSTGYPDPWTEDYQHIRIAYNAEGTQQLRSNQPVTKLVSYSDTYDHDCPKGKKISEIPENEHTMIPVHHEKKQIQDDTHTIPLYDMHCFKKEYGTEWNTNPNPPVGITSETTENTQMVFTVFINELYYYYTDGVILKTEQYGDDGYVTPGTETPRDYTMWKNFVNRTDGRTFILFTDMNDSSDGDSHHLTARYNIYQRSIETFYDKHILDGYSAGDPNIPSALGIEQINEHHWKNLAFVNYNYNGKTEADGWGRTSMNVIGHYWSEHVDQNHVMGTYHSAGTGSEPNAMDQQYPTFRTKSAREKFNTNSINYKTFTKDIYNYEIVDAAMNRNRDLNRDGVITQDEVRWFAPTASQYTLFAISGAALQNAMFEKEHFDPSQTYWQWGTGAKNLKTVYGNGNFHYAGLDQKYVVAEEGTSTGKSSAAHNTQYAGEIRCARYLGVPNGDNGYDGITLPEPVQYNENTRVLSTIGYDQQMRRRNTSSSLVAHDNFNYGSFGLNSLPDYFQMAKANSNHTIHIREQVVARGGTNLEQNFIDMINENYFCKDYYENADQSDRGTWRMPNMVEIATMTKYAGLEAGPDRSTNQNNPELISCTYWFRNQDLYDANPSKTSGYEGERETINGKEMFRHFLGAKKEGDTNLLTMIHTNRLYNNGYWFNTRCVRDTDKDGNFVGQPEYGNPVNFQAGEFTATYVGDNVNMQVGASITAGTFQSVTIDGHEETGISGLNISSSVSNVPVTKSKVTVNWKIEHNGKILSYIREYQLPTRYWMISFHSITNRYATVNMDNNRTYVGAADNRDNEEIEAIYKWVITTSPTADPVNVSNLQENTDYYLYNAGTKQYISGPTGGTQTYMTVGGTPMKMKLIKQSDGIYTLRFNDATHANKNGGDGNFGTWTGTGTGNHYKLTPVVLKGEMPLLFTFDSDYVVSGSNYSVRIETDPTAVIGSVTIAGQTATVTGPAGHYTATVAASAISSSASTIETVWNVTKGSDSYVKRKTYYRHIKYYVISSETGPQQYAYADGNTNKTAADATPYTGDIKDLDANHQWIFTTTKTNVGVDPVNANVFADLNSKYYIYNKGTGKYINGPNINKDYTYIEIGPAVDAMKALFEARSRNLYSIRFPDAVNANHCITTWKNSPDPTVFGIFQTATRDRNGFRFYLHPIYE